MESRRIHQSLLRTPLFLDVPIEILVLEVLFFLLAAVFLGLSFASLLPTLLVIGAFHQSMKKATRDDPQAVAIFLDALAYRPSYPAHGTLAPRRAISPRPSLPRL